ncbi:MAG: hypothetical protein ABII71_00065 [Candidatus Micrarchaeota archaeon]
MVNIGEKMDNVTISEVLIKRNKRVCTSKDIAELTSEKEYLKKISSLINTNWIVPVGFRGIYYVKDPEERSRSFLKLDNFQILNKVLNIAFGDEWYFGRITSLSLSGRIHQPVSTYYILNKRFSRTFTSDILGKVFLMKTSAGISGKCGILAKKHAGETFYLCSIERNIADYIYSYVHSPADKKQIAEMCRKYLPDKEKLVDTIIRCYPRASAIKMVSIVKEVYQ